MPYSPIRPPVPRSSAGFWKARNHLAVPGGPYRLAASFEALAGPLGGGAGRPGRLQVAVPGRGGDQRPGGANPLQVLLQGAVQAEQGVGGPLDRGLGRWLGLEGLEGGHDLAGGANRPRRRRGHRAGHPDVAAGQGQDAEQAQRPATEPLLGGQGVGLGLVDQDQAVGELAGLEPAGPGEQGPGQGQVLFDQLGLAHGLPGDGGSAGQDEAEQHQDEQTTHEDPPSDIPDRR